MVVVRAAATAITHAEYVKQAWLQGEEGSTLSIRGALGVHMIKIPLNAGNYSRSWHCASVVVRAATTAIKRL